MKSIELEAREASETDADQWLQKIRASQKEKLDAAFLGAALERRYKFAKAFTLGVLTALAVQLLQFISVFYSLIALGVVSTIGVVVSLVLFRATIRATMQSTAVIRAASSTIKIVADDPLPAKDTPAPTPEASPPA